MGRQLNMTKFRHIRADDQCWCLPMVVTGSLSMTLEKSVEDCRLTRGSVLIGYGGYFNVFPSHVWL